MFKEDILLLDATTVIPPEGNLYHTLSYAGLLKSCTNRESFAGSWMTDPLPYMEARRAGLEYRNFSKCLLHPVTTKSSKATHGPGP